MICLDLWTQLRGSPLDLKRKEKTKIKTKQTKTNNIKVLQTYKAESDQNTSAL
jgi:hypothetical protein